MFVLASKLFVRIVANHAFARSIGVITFVAFCLTAVTTRSEVSKAVQRTAIKQLDEKTFRELFNGRDLDGWEGQPRWWTVEDGVLTCESTAERPCSRSHYLYWTGGQLADFELLVVYRIHGNGNSGVQIRSERRPHWDAWGYQADIDTAGQYMGCLYQHDRGLVADRGQRVSFNQSGQKRSEPLGQSIDLLKAVHTGDWNTYRILAKGPVLTLWINDVLMCQVKDLDKKYARRKGILALQMHQGPPMKIEFKSIRLRVLEHASEGAKPEEAPRTKQVDHDEH